MVAACPCVEGADHHDDTTEDHRTEGEAPCPDDAVRDNDAGAGTGCARTVHPLGRRSHCLHQAAAAGTARADDVAAAAAVHHDSTGRAVVDSNAGVGTESTVHPSCRFPNEEEGEDHGHQLHDGPRKSYRRAIKVVYQEGTSFEHTPDLPRDHGCQSFHVPPVQEIHEAVQTLQDIQDEDGGGCRRHRHQGYVERHRTLPAVGDVPPEAAVPSQEAVAVPTNHETGLP
jgi:hypothetical protein